MKMEETGAGMLPHLTIEELEAFRQGALPPEKLLDVGDHLQECDVCSATAARSTPAQEQEGAFQAVRTTLLEEAQAAPLHLSPEQLFSLVDGEMGEVDREIADAHMESCPQCAREFQELRTFRGVLSSYPASGQPLSSQPVAAGNGRSRFWARPWLWVPPLAVGVAAGTAALLFVTLAQPLQREVAEQEARVRTLLRERDQLVQEAKQREGNKLPGTGITPPRNIAGTPKSPGGTKIAKGPGGERTVTTAQAEQEQRKAAKLLADAREAGRQQGLAEGRRQAARGGADTRVASLAPEPLLNAEGQLVLPDPNAPGGVRPLKQPGRMAMLISPDADRTLGGEGSPPRETPIQLINPVATTTRSQRPTLTWQAHPSATRYQVSLYRLPGDQPLLTEEVAGRTEWQPAKDLAPEGIYAWEVQAFVGQEELALSPVARFQVLAPAATQQLRKAERQARTPLARAALYVRYGLLAEARHLLQAQNENPVARRMLEEIKPPQKPK
jgi:anti-sigma factor RsiW